MLEEYSFQELLKIGMYTQLMENERLVFRRHTVIRLRLQVILNRAAIVSVSMENRCARKLTYASYCYSCR
jgi:hypothetical protein